MKVGGMKVGRKRRILWDIEQVKKSMGKLGEGLSITESTRCNIPRKHYTRHAFAVIFNDQGVPFRFDKTKAVPFPEPKTLQDLYKNCEVFLKSVVSIEAVYSFGVEW